MTATSDEDRDDVASVWEDVALTHDERRVITTRQLGPVTLSDGTPVYPLVVVTEPRQAGKSHQAARRLAARLGVHGPTT